MENFEFKISGIKIENFRGIKKLELDGFSSSMNAIVGVNGAGKSSVLHAIDILFSWFSARIRNAKGNGLTISDDDISHGASFCSMEITLSNGVSWRLFKQKSTSRKKISEKSRLVDMTDYVNNILVHNEDCPLESYLPLYSFYGVNRIVEETPTHFFKDGALNPADVYNRELDNAQNYRSLFRWFKEREDAENREFRLNPQGFVEDRQLKAVRKAIESIMPGYTNLHVRTQPNRFVVDKDGIQFCFDSLSDGEKAYLALAADIARKLAMSHPHDDEPLKASAIILIDEIDLHLHPSWQRDVLPNMTRTFENCQFVVSTHSPFILNNINSHKNDKLFLMEKGVLAVLPNNVYGREVGLVLNEVLQMDSLRNTEVEKRLRVIWECLRNGDVDSNLFNENMGWLHDNLESSDLVFAKIALQQRINQKHSGK